MPAKNDVTLVDRSGATGTLTTAVSTRTDYPNSQPGMDSAGPARWALYTESKLQAPASSSNWQISSSRHADTCGEVFLKGRFAPAAGDGMWHDPRGCVPFCDGGKPAPRAPQNLYPPIIRGISKARLSGGAGPEVVL